MFRIIGRYTYTDTFEVIDSADCFDEAEITVDEYGTTDGVTVNDCIENDLVTKSLVVTSESDDMFCYYNNESCS